MIFTTAQLNDPIKSFVKAESSNIDSIHVPAGIPFDLWDFLFDSTNSGKDHWYMVDDRVSVHFCGMTIDRKLFVARWYYDKNTGFFFRFSAYRLKTKRV